MKFFKRMWVFSVCLISMTLIFSSCKQSNEEPETLLEENMLVDGSEEDILDDNSEENAITNDTEEGVLAYEIGDGLAKTHGALQVIDGQLSDQFGEPIQLKGMSSHGLQWYGSLINDDVFNTLVNDWGIDVFRGAMYTVEDGYIDPVYRSVNFMRINQVVQHSTNHGIYTIVDWHVHREEDPLVYLDEAIEFFEKMAKTYQHFDNVIYEICNEPNGAHVTWSDNIKPYAEAVIPVIRKYNPDAIIIVGTPSWSQHVDAPIEDPLEFDNIMYTLHFYAGTHGEELRERTVKALDHGLGIFVTEWGTSEASGGGGVFVEKSDIWLDFLDEHMISWCNWSLADKAESSAALLVNASRQGDWPDDRISESGHYVRDKLQEGR